MAPILRTDGHDGCGRRLSLPPVTRGRFAGHTMSWLVLYTGERSCLWDDCASRSLPPLTFGKPARGIIKEILFEIRDRFSSKSFFFFLLDGWASRGTRAGYGIQSSGSWLVFADVLSSPRARERCNVTRGGYCSTRSLDEVSHLSEEFLIILQYSTLHLEI